MLRCPWAALSVVVFVAARAAAQTPDYGYEWRTIGSPGNRPANAIEARLFYPPYQPAPFLVGQVNHEYRMARTEVTVHQWFEFVNAYWPHLDGSYGDVNFTSEWIVPTNPVPGQNPNYVIRPGAANIAADMSWRMAARYCNWLHNDKALNAAAFESGVYDTSTFTDNPDGTFNDQRSHSPGARFWIPTLDEWTKAMYYDPNGNGPGLDRYWQYPTSSDSIPIPGPPGVGQTSAGWSGPPYFDVGAYADVQSPWGLLDGSGSSDEWTEFSGTSRVSRAVKGTHQGFNPAWDRIDWFGGGFPDLGGPGLRLASVIPVPGTVAIIGAGAVFACLRRRAK